MSIKTFTCTSNQYIELERKLNNIKSKISLGLKNGCPFNPSLLDKALQDILDGRYYKEKNKILRLISGNINLVVQNVSEDLFIEEVSNNSGLSVNLNFVGPRDEENRRIIDENLVEVYEMYNENASFIQMFSSLSDELTKLSLSGGQIINFCKNYPNWLSQKGFPTFFMILIKEETFIVSVRLINQNLIMFLFRPELNIMWNSYDQYRVVIPQQVI